MKSKLQNSLKFLKRFFEPAFLDKAASLKIFTNGTFSALLRTIIPLFFIPKIIHFIEINDRSSAALYSTIALSLFLLVILIRAQIMYYWFWAMNIPFEKALYKKYIPIVLQIQPAIFEKNGTGYHLSKFTSGIKGLRDTSREVLENIPNIALGLVMAFYILFQTDLKFGVWGTVYSFAFVVILVFVYRKEVELIYPSLEIWNRVSGDIARIIMSKQEIVYSDRTKKEVDLISIKVDKGFEIEKETFRYSIRRFTYLSNFTAFIFLSFLLLQAYGKINYSVSEIATLALLANSFYTLTGTFFQITGVLFDNYKTIKAFWEMVDEPKMVGYNEGEEFVHRGGEVELRNISFGYEK